MESTIKLNLGCGFKQMVGYIGVDAFGNPDVKHDLNSFPYPWDDNTVSEIQAHHIMEHLDDWWPAFLECARILKPGGILEIRVPDAASVGALTYRDHFHVFSLLSFHGIQGAEHGTSAWAAEEKNEVPLKLTGYHQVPHKQYNWMTYRPFRWLLAFCANHMRNFIWEQRFIFEKVG